MKALILKDLFTITRQLKIFLILALFFACLPGYSLSGFAIVYVAMLPVSALAYDERSKWNSLAAMMPYSPRSIVASKYVLGYAGIFLSAVISIIAQLIISVFTHTEFEAVFLLSVISVVLVATLMLALTLPFMFRYGVEKGRLAFFAIVAIVTVFITLVQNTSVLNTINTTNTPLILIAAAIFSAAINIISIFISEKAYLKRKN